MSILSILKWTNFTGEIIVLSDSDHLNDHIDKIYPNIRVINIVKDISFLSRKNINRFNIYCLKPLIKNYIDFSRYEMCLYLDSDILIKSDRFNEILKFWHLIGKIQVLDNEGWNVEKWVPSTGSQILSEKEKQENLKFGVCAGAVAIPSNLANEFLNDWMNLNIAGDFSLDDQGNLTALLIRGSHQYEFMDFHNKNKNLAVNITHYHSKHKPLFWQHSRFLLNEHFSSDSPDLSGKYNMSKPSENINNIWEFKNGIVFVNNPMITGTCQKTAFGTYVWWNTIDGFEIIKKDLKGNSFKGGSNSFILKKV